MLGPGSPYDTSIYQDWRHRRRPGGRLCRAAVVDAARGHRVLQARRRGDDAARARGRASACSCTATWSPTRSCASRTRSSTASRCRTTGRSSTASYYGHRARHVQGRSRGRAEGHADAARVRGRTERRDGEVPVEVRSQAGAARAEEPGVDGGRAAAWQLIPWPHSAILLLATFVVCSYAAAASVAGARRRSRRLIESGIGAFYLVDGADDGRVGRHRPRVRHRRLLDQVRPALLGHASSRCSTRSRRTGAGSTARSCSGCSCCRCSAPIAVYVNRERHRELIPYVVAIISTVQMFFLFLMVVHKNPFDTFLTQAPADGRGLNPLLQNSYMVDPSAVALHGLRRDDDPVRVRHGGAHHRAPRRLVAARGAPLDDVRAGCSCRSA